jgi:acyl transferase domain-containing protein
MNRDYQLFLLSAPAPEALQRKVENLKTFFPDHPGTSIADAAYTLNTCGESFPYRRYFVAGDAQDIPDILSSQESGETGNTAETAETEVIFMFPGQGAQYVDMGRELYEKESSFRQEMDMCYQIMHHITGTSFKDILYPSKSDAGSGKQAEEKINNTQYTQPLLFAFEYSLAKFLIGVGIKPDCMIGHSIGEFTAACLSGVFSLEDALKIVIKRGQLMSLVPAGSMLSVSRSPQDLAPLLQDEQLCLAAVNSPDSTVISGNNQDIAWLEEELKEKKIRTRRLYTSHAFHSYMMEPVLPIFEKELKNVSFKKQSTPFISNVTGKLAKFEEISTPTYWATHLRHTIKFSEGIKTLIAGNNGKKMIFSEVGPGRALSTFLRKHEIDKNCISINLVKHPQENKSDQCYLLSKLGEFWLHGLEINWNNYYKEEKRNIISLL